MGMRMSCERCQSKDAAVRLLEVTWTGGAPSTQTQTLCLSCARAAGVNLPHAQGFSAVVQMLSQGLLPAMNAAGKSEKAAASENRSCSHCGWTMRDLRQTSRFGCPHDYEAFREATDDLLERLQGAAQHCDLREESALDRLGAEMRAAVEREDYEAAARLRDQLRALEASLEQEDALD